MEPLVDALGSPSWGAFARRMQTDGRARLFQSLWRQLYMSQKYWCVRDAALNLSWRDGGRDVGPEPVARACDLSVANPAFLLRQRRWVLRLAEHQAHVQRTKAAREISLSWDYQQAPSLCCVVSFAVPPDAASVFMSWEVGGRPVGQGVWHVPQGAEPWTRGGAAQLRLSRAKPLGPHVLVRPTPQTAALDVVFVGRFYLEPLPGLPVALPTRCRQRVRISCGHDCFYFCTHAFQT